MKIHHRLCTREHVPSALRPRVPMCPAVLFSCHRKIRIWWRDRGLARGGSLGGEGESRTRSFPYPVPELRPARPRIARAARRRNGKVRTSRAGRTAVPLLCAGPAPQAGTRARRRNQNPESTPVDPRRPTGAHPWDLQATSAQKLAIYSHPSGGWRVCGLCWLMSMAPDGRAILPLLPITQTELTEMLGWHLNSNSEQLPQQSHPQ